MSTAQKTIGGGTADCDDLSRQFADAGDSVTALADRLGTSERECAKLLLAEEDIEPAAPFCIERLRPEDLGLSPLGCGECGQADIGTHPCPDCGFDPRATDRDNHQLTEWEAL